MKKLRIPSSGIGRVPGAIFHDSGGVTKIDFELKPWPKLARLMGRSQVGLIGLRPRSIDHDHR